MASFEWMLLTEPTYNRARLTRRLAGEILSQKALPNVSPISTTRALASQQSRAHGMMHAYAAAP